MKSYLKSKLIIRLLTPFLAVSCFAQDTLKTGVHFERGLTWAQIIEEAKTAHKGIFVDCFATWCGPCKAMDEVVYSNEQVGKYINEHFISVKAQMDRTPGDNEETKAWYRSARQLAGEYAVTAYPTFLFFSPQGRPLHKVVGSMNAEAFIKIAQDSRDPGKQYYHILENYRPGKLDTGELKVLSRSFIDEDQVLAGKMAVDYLSRIQLKSILTEDNVKFIRELKDNEQVKAHTVKLILGLGIKEINNKNYRALLAIFNGDNELQAMVMQYLSSQTEAALYSPKNISLITNFAKKVVVHDRFFDLFYNHGNRVDSVTGSKGSSERMIDYVIYTEIIAPRLQRADSAGADPDWMLLSGEIARQSDPKTAERNLLSSKVWFYGTETHKAEKRNDSVKWIWGKKFAGAAAAQIRKNGIDTSGNLFSLAGTGNLIEYSIYRYDTDKEDIKVAICGLQKIMTYFPGISFSYVYAGLLYKTGQKQPAIAWQEMTVQLAEGLCYQQKKAPEQDKFYLQQLGILNKMNAGKAFNDLVFFP